LAKRWRLDAAKTLGRISRAAGSAHVVRVQGQNAPVVLAVDDQPLNLELLHEYLSATGCKLVTASSGVAALEAIRRVGPDLVLLDVVMPGLDGIEVCRRIKADPVNRLLPVVLVTSLSSVSDRVRALEAGADDFLTKPIDRHELMARVLTLMRTKEIYDKLDDAEHVMAAFAKVVEAKDGGTEAHVERVGRAARALAEAAGMSRVEMDLVYFGGVVHDIGKVGVPDALLLKPGPLNPDELIQMRRHVLVGVEIARELRSAANVVPIIKHHHERFDGTGYPDGLVGADIPRMAMVVSICDAYDAMTSDRPYRAAIPSGVAIAELRRGAGMQWDPDLVGRFLSHVMQEPTRRVEISDPSVSSPKGIHTQGGR
jgi:putative two-component system response regulator